MNDTKTTTAEPKHNSSIWTDLGPVIAYVLMFNLARKFINKEAEFNLLGQIVPGQDAPLYIGTLVFAIAIIIAVIVSKIKTGKVSIMLWVTAVLVLGAAAITIGFKNPTIFKMKPTAINLLFSGAILGSLAMGKNVFKAMMGGAYDLPDKVWRTLAFRWAIFFIFLAVVNEFVWRNYSTDFWSNFKLMGMFPLTLIFTMLNLPLMMKYMKNEDK
ncbi:MAG: inner membrane-spanning protein YciB [Robiginitomaculum sp.]